MEEKCFLPKLRKRKVERRRTDDNKQKRPRVGQGGKLIEVDLLCIVAHYGNAGHKISGSKDFKLGLKPKRKLRKKKVRAEPEVSSSDEEYEAMTQVI